jgi:hypothetical protein
MPVVVRGGSVTHARAAASSNEARMNDVLRIYISATAA